MMPDENSPCTNGSLETLDAQFEEKTHFCCGMMHASSATEQRFFYNPQIQRLPSNSSPILQTEEEELHRKIEQNRIKQQELKERREQCLKLKETKLKRLADLQNSKFEFESKRIGKIETEKRKMDRRQLEAGISQEIGFLEEQLKTDDYQIEEKPQKTVDFSENFSSQPYDNMIQSWTKDYYSAHWTISQYLSQILQGEQSLSPQNFDHVCYNVLNLVNYAFLNALSSPLLISVPNILENALNDPSAAFSLWAKLISLINAEFESKQFAPNPLPIATVSNTNCFRKILIEFLRMKFRELRNWKIQETFGDNPNYIRALMPKLEKGNRLIAFCGELFKQKLLFSPVIHSLIRDLLFLNDNIQNNIDFSNICCNGFFVKLKDRFENLEIVANLLAIVGKYIEKDFPSVSTSAQAHPKELDTVFKIFNQILSQGKNFPEFGQRNKIILVELMNLRENGWQTHSKQSGSPKSQNQQQQKKKTYSPQEETEFEGQKFVNFSLYDTLSKNSRPNCKNVKNLNKSKQHNGANGAQQQRPGMQSVYDVRVNKENEIPTSQMILVC